jgi:hypothetical protein
VDLNRADFGQVGGPECKDDVELVVRHGNPVDVRKIQHYVVVSVRNVKLVVETSVPLYPGPPFLLRLLMVNPLLSVAICPSVLVTVMLRVPTVAFPAIEIFAVSCVDEL